MKKNIHYRSYSLRLFVVSVSILIGLIFAHQTTPAAEAQSRPVCAFYYAWYDHTSFGPGKTPYTPYEYYTSRHQHIINRHVREAKGTGIDCFIQSWYGPGNQTEDNFKTLLEVGKWHNFKAAVHFEVMSPFFHTPQQRIDALKLLINTHTKHPSYMRLHGKPVIFFWSNNQLSVQQWQYIRNQVDPYYTTIWVAEGGHTQYLSVFDGLHLYNVSWAGSPSAVAARWASATRNFNGSKRYWMGTAMPGFDERHIPGRSNPNYRTRDNGEFLRLSFAGAAATNPDIMLITSYNEWVEASHIEPSVEFGGYYLNLTRDLISQYKAYRPFAIPQPPAPAPKADPPSQPSDIEPSADEEDSIPIDIGPVHIH